MLWGLSKDGQKGQNRPQSLVLSLTGEEKKESDTLIFNSPDDFEAARQRILGEVNQNGD